jgi:hypothetical protein
MKTWEGRVAGPSERVPQGGGGEGEGQSTNSEN